jgi:hypothetical protein
MYPVVSALAAVTVPELAALANAPERSKIK